MALQADTGTSATDGLTNNGILNITGIEANATWQYSTDSGANWTTETGTTFTLVEGAYAVGQIRVRQTDLAGNLGTATSNTAAITVDTTAPLAPNFTLQTDSGASATDSITNIVTVNVSNIETGATWQYSTNSGANWTNGTGTTFTLTEGTYTPGVIQIRQTDPAGNTTNPPGQNSTTITIDTSVTAPNLALAADNGASTTDSITNNGTINITGLETGATWQYSTNSGGTWTNGTGTNFTLAPGSYGVGTIRIRQTDLAGNISTTPRQNTNPITIDTTPPAAPGLALQTDAGISATDSITNNGTISVSNIEANASWEYSINSGTWTAGGTGTSFVLTQGNYEIGAVKVRQTDLAGNTTTNQNSAAITIDTTPPAAPVIALQTDSGASATDGITNIVTINVSAIEKDSIWEYSADSGANWTPGTGNSFTLTAGTYAAGVVKVRQTDTAGNTTTNQNSATITIDTTVAAPGLEVASGTTNNSTVNITGLETGATWEYSINNGSTWLAGTGTNFTLAAGTYAAGVIKVRQTDLAGNLSTVNQNSGAITLDLTPPTALSFALANDTGASGSDGVTSNGTINVNLTGLEAGATWQYSTDNGSNWVTGTVANFTLAEGTYAAGVVKVRQTDIAGNTTTNQNSATITVDITAPAINLSSTSIAENNLANAVVATLTATDANTVTYALVSGTNDVDNTAFNINGNQLRINNPADFETKNNYSIRVRATDIAGNFTDTTNTINIVDVPEYSVIESVGNTALVKNETSKLFTQVGTASPIAIQATQLGLPTISATTFPGWQTLAAETVNGDNQLLWKNTDNNYLHLWHLDGNWNWLSSEGQFSLDSTEALGQETVFGIDANGDGKIGYAIIEANGNTAFLKDATNKLFAQVGTTTPIAIQASQLGLPTISVTTFPGWQTLAAETVNGDNQLLWKNTDNNYLHLWHLDGNWNWLSSESQFSLDSTEAFTQETNFGIDANGDGKVGNPYTTIESVGNTSLVKNTTSKLFTQVGTASPIAIQATQLGLPTISVTTFPGWQTLAAETVNGDNQLLWKNTDSNYLHLWHLDSNWNWLSSEGQFSLDSTEALGQETVFGIDANGDGKVGSPSSLTLTGTGGNDVLVGGANADVFTGGLGNDNLYLGFNDNAVDTVNYAAGDGADTIYQFVRGVGGDKLNFTGIPNVDVISLGGNTEVRVGDGIANNGGFGSGQLLTTLSGTTGFTATDVNINLFGGSFLYS